MKKSVKIIYIFILISIIIIQFSNVFATDTKNQFKVIKNKSEIRNLENNQGQLYQTILTSDTENGEFTIQTTLKNTSQTDNESTVIDSTEIYVVVSEEIATEDEVLNSYISYIETLSKKVFEKNSKTKIGIIGIQGTIMEGVEDENGNVTKGGNDQADIIGTANNAEIIVKPTDNIDTIKSKLKSMNSGKKSYYSNLQAAIRLANNSYSKNVNKMLILLFDGIPEISIGTCATIYGDVSNNVEDAVNKYNDVLVENTKNEILKLKESNVAFIQLKPDNTSFDQKWYDAATGELSFTFYGSKHVEKLYGTMENPVYGKLYSLNSDSLEKIVTEYIFEDIISEVEKTMKSTIVKLYFSKEIIDNFEIIISENGKIDSSKLDSDGIIVWNIGELEKENTVTLEYKLKIKDINNTALLGKTIKTNEEIELSYINYTEKETKEILEENPEIQVVTQIAGGENNEEDSEEEKNQEIKQDDTISKETLPKAGMINLLIIMIIITINLIIIWKKSAKYKDVK